MADKLTTGVKAGEAIVGTAVEYAPYVEYGTRKQKAQPYLAPSMIVVSQKLAGEYKKDSLLEIRAAVAKSYNRSLGKDVTYKGPNVSDMLKATDLSNEKTLAAVAAAAAGQAKRLSPVLTSNLRKSIMWKTVDKNGGFGAQ